MEIRIGTDNPEDRPKVHGRRSVLAVVSGLALIGFCLFVVGGTIAMLFDPPARPYVCFYGPVSLFLAYSAFQQYRLIFCTPSEIPRAKIGCFLALGGLLTLFGVACIGGMLSDPKPPENLLKWLFCFGGILLCGLIVLAIGLANVMQQKRLLPEKNLFAIDECEKVSWNNAKKYWKNDGFAVLLMSIIACIIAFAIVQFEIPQNGSHMTYEEFPFQELFPENGSDFCYIRGYRGTLCCDFSIDEQGFRDWIASQSRWEYCRPLESGDWIWITWSENKPKIEDGGISEGLYAGYGNGKGGRAVFDRKRNRAYFWTYY